MWLMRYWFFSVTIKLLSRYVSINFFYKTYFILFSFTILYLSTRFLSFDPFEPCSCNLESSVSLLPSFSFRWVFCAFFGFCECWLPEMLLGFTAKNVKTSVKSQPLTFITSFFNFFYSNITIYSLKEIFYFTYYLFAAS